MALALLCVVAVWAYLNRSAPGRRMRATVQNRQLAAVCGIHTGGADRLTFFIGSGLAGVAGVGLTLIGPIGPTLMRAMASAPTCACSIISFSPPSCIDGYI